LQESALPNLLQYINRWEDDTREKIAVAIGIMLSQGLITITCLHSLTKDHLIKDDVAAVVIARIFKTYLSKQPIGHLTTILRPIELSSYFPQNKRDDGVIGDFFRTRGLGDVADWWARKKNSILKAQVIDTIKEAQGRGDSADDIVAAIQTMQEEQPLPEVELIQCIWAGLMASIEWSQRPDQHRGLILTQVTSFSEILKQFCINSSRRLALINTVQEYCHKQPRVMKSFPQILKVLYDKDCVTDGAIIYWYQKGAIGQGKQYFLEAAEPLVKLLQEPEEDESE